MIIMEQFWESPYFMTPGSLAEYARYITGIRNISVDFFKIPLMGCAAYVDIRKNKIYLPAFDYFDYFDQPAKDTIRKTKALLFHECAHLMYPDDSYLGYYSAHSNMLASELLQRNILQIIDDLRIETLIGMKYPEIRNDFTFLIDCIWLENYAIPAVDDLVDDLDVGNGRFGDFSCSLNGSLFWLLQKRYRKASLLPPPGCRNILPFKPVKGFEAFFETAIVPMMDEFVVSEDPALQTSIQIVYLLENYLRYIKKQYRKIKTQEVKLCQQ